jgi:hypothetical protein
MGISILATAGLSVFINIKGYSGMFWGQDEVTATKTATTIAVPEKDEKETEEVNA